MNLNTLKQVHYFRYNVAIREFVRAYADLIEFTPHKLHIKTKKGERIIESDYDMSKMIVGDWLIAGFLWKRKTDSVPKMYPLGEKSGIFNEPVVEYEKLNRKEYLLGGESVQALQRQLQNVETQLKEWKQIRAEMQYGSKKMAEELRPATATPSVVVSEPAPTVSSAPAAAVNMVKGKKAKKEVLLESDEKRLKKARKIVKDFFK